MSADRVTGGNRPERKPRRTATAIRLDPDLHEWITQAAIERDLSINWLINLAVRELQDRLIPVDEIKWTRD